MKTKTEIQTIDSFPYEGDENPLERNKEEFKANALVYINEWELPAIHDMYPNDYEKCKDLKTKFDKLKKDLMEYVTNL